MRTLFILSCVSSLMFGCAGWERVKESGPEIAGKAVEAGEKIIENPSWTTVLAEVGGWLAFVVGIALGGKELADRKRFVRNGK